MIKTLIKILFILLPVSSISQIKTEDEYIIVHPAPPSYKHGESAMYDTINKYLKSFNIPDTLSKNIRVYTSFLVDSGGNVSDIVLTRGYSNI